MAVLKNLILAASVLAPIVAAVPMPGRNQGIYTNTVTEIAWVTVEETTTVWVDASEPTPAPVAATNSSSPAEATGSPATLQTLAAAPQAPPTSIPSVSPVAAYTPAPADPSPAPSSTVAPIPASSPVALTSPAMVTLQPKATVSNGMCTSESDACSGDVTHWDGGLGACGWNVNSDSDYSIALPYEFMGTQSNGNPYCGRSVTLFNPTSGTTVQATIGDKCMGCTGRSIDCTNILFNAITDGKGDGRVSGIQWWLN